MDPQIRQLTILAGPRFKVLRAERTAAMIYALIGTARIRRADPHALGLPTDGTYTFAASFGGSLDLNVRPRVAIRLVEPSLFLNRYCAGRNDCSERSFRLAMGMIFRFLDR